MVAMAMIGMDNLMISTHILDMNIYHHHFPAMFFLKRSLSIDEEKKNMPRFNMDCNLNRPAYQHITFAHTKRWSIGRQPHRTSV